MKGKRSRREKTKDERVEQIFRELQEKGLIDERKGGDKIRDVYIFIDESGDLGRFGTNYFTIAGLVVDEPISLRRIIKKARQRKLKKKIKELPELKANKTNKVIRKYILSKVASSECQIFAIAVDKSMIMPRLYEVKDRLYNYICGILVNEIVSNYDLVHIIIDKKHTNTLIRENFNHYLIKKIKSRHNRIIIDISHRDSQSTPELQVVDFVAWAINRKFNTGDDEYYRIIENKIINKGRMELWKN